MASRSPLVVILGISLGALLILLGIADLASVASSWLDTGGWYNDPAFDLLNTVAVKRLLPDSLVSWLQRPQSLYGVHGMLRWLLQVPAWLFLMLLGGLISWVTTRR
jgi:hypothetical protein